MFSAATRMISDRIRNMRGAFHLQRIEDAAIELLPGDQRGSAAPLPCQNAGQQRHDFFRDQCTISSMPFTPSPVLK